MSNAPTPLDNMDIAHHRPLSSRALDMAKAPSRSQISLAIVHSSATFAANVRATPGASRYTQDLTARLIRRSGGTAAPGTHPQHHRRLQPGRAIASHLRHQVTMIVGFSAAVFSWPVQHHAQHHRRLSRQPPIIIDAVIIFPDQRVKLAMPGC